MHAKLRAGFAAGRECGDCDQLAAPEIQRIPGIKVAERKLDHHPGEIGSDFSDAAGNEMGKLVGGESIGDDDSAAITIAHCYSFGLRPNPRTAASPRARKTPPTAAAQP